MGETSTGFPMLTPADVENLTFYVVADLDDSALIGVDSGSGYPFKSRYWSGIKLFSSKEAADAFRGLPGQRCKVLRLNLVLSDPEAEDA